MLESDSPSVPACSYSRLILPPSFFPITVRIRPFSRQSMLIHGVPPRFPAPNIVRLRDLPPGFGKTKCLHFAWISHWIYIYQPGHHAFPHPKDAACRFFPRRFHSCSCVPKAILPVSGRRTLSILSPLRRRWSLAHVPTFERHVRERSRKTGVRHNRSL